MYGFTLNRKRPGHFNLCFLASKNSIVQTWPVRVAPEAFYLFDAAAVGVPELCDAFKVRHLHETQNMAVSGGKTPYGAGMGRTPARTGGATPGHMSVRQPNRTPNPYGGGQTPFAGQMAPPFAPPPPHPHHGGYNGYQGQTPNHRPPYPNQQPPPPPPNMNQPRPPPVYHQARGWP
jgi:transcription elongation factor SPT6